MYNTSTLVETEVEGPKAIETALFSLLTFLLEVPESSQNSRALLNTLKTSNIMGYAGLCGSKDTQYSKL